MAAFEGIDGEVTRLLKEVETLEKEAVTTMQQATRIMFVQLFARTPVWSGETVRNYAVGLGSKPAGGSKGYIGRLPPRGETRGQALGEERNRSANESAALADAEGVITGMKKLQDVVVTNFVSSSKWDLIDNGSAPTPATARNPGGVSVLATQSTRNALRGRFK